MQKILGLLVVLLSQIFMDYALAAVGEKRSLEHGGIERSYLLHRPENLSRNAPVPLVIMLHGGFGSGEQAEKSYNWDEKADAAGFVVAYPDGVGRTWNAGECCGAAARGKIDDLGFITKLIEAVVSSENIDARRVYITGMSNGAAMGYRYACAGEYPVAAVGAVAGSLSVACPNPRKLSLLAINGLLDNHVPFNGGVGGDSVAKVNWLPVSQAIEIFRKANNCQPAAQSKTGSVATSSAACEQGRAVNLITIDDAGHQWPSGHKYKWALRKMLLSPDEPSKALDATATLWEFFKDKRGQQ